MRRRVAALLAVGLLAAGCSDGGSEPSNGGADGENEATEETGGRPALGDGQSSHRVGVAFQYDTFEITIGEVVYDEELGELALGLRFHNLGEAWARPEPTAVLDVDGTEHPVLATVPNVPPRMAADLTWSVTGLGADPVPDGVIRWGSPDRDQPVVHLDGSSENLWRPVPVDIESATDGWAGIGKYSVHLTGAQLLAASPGAGTQAEPGTRILRLLLDTFAHHRDAVTGFYPVDNLTLRLPDGTTARGVHSSPGFHPLSWTAVGGSFVDFPVPEASVAGDYELALSSVSPNALGTLHPDRIETVPIPFSLEEPAAPPVEAEEPLPFPELPDDGTSPPDASPVTVELSSREVNVGGFLFRPEELRWDPAAQQAELDGEVRWIESATPTDMVDIVGGLLDVPPAFSFSAALVSQGRYYEALTPADPFVDPAAPAPVTLEILGVEALDPDDLGLVIGPSTGAPSSLPLTGASPLPLYPPLPTTGRIDGPEVAADEWTVRLTGYRVGFLQSTSLPPPGSLDLEVFLTVTASPNARPGTLGLSFTPAAQLFLAGPDGYMQQASTDSGTVFYEPGQTKRQSVTFRVADVFEPGPMSFVLRGTHEVTAVFDDEWTETTFGAVLQGTGNDQEGGGL